MNAHIADLFPLQARLVTPERAAELQRLGRDLMSLDLDARLCTDIEMLGNGAYTPLRGFMGQAEYESVRDTMRLLDGQFWPMPLLLNVAVSIATQLHTAQSVALRNGEGVLLAILTIEEIWRSEAQTFIGGPVEVVALPQHHDFLSLRLSPTEIRTAWRSRPHDTLFIFQTETIVSPAFFGAVLAAARGLSAHLLWQVCAGELAGNEMAYVARIGAHQAQFKQAMPQQATLALLSLNQIERNLRGALFKAVIARNFGASHVGLSGISADALLPYQTSVGLSLVALPESEQYEKDLLLALNKDDHIPPSVAASAVVAELRKVYPKRTELGFCVFFTGLSGAGKSTLAKALMTELLEQSGRQVTLLDGDIVRKMLSSELGFSREHRAMNVRRIAYVASEIVKHRGIALCAPIAPYTAMRQDARAQVERYGGFFEMYVATPLAICESRDRKGLYAKARAGLVKEFTGVSDPYETPACPELSIDTSNITVGDAIVGIIQRLRDSGYLK